MKLLQTQGGLPKGPPQGLWSALGNFCSTLIFNFDNTEPLQRGGLYVCIHTYIYMCAYISIYKPSANPGGPPQGVSPMQCLLYFNIQL